MSSYSERIQHYLETFQVPSHISQPVSYALIVSGVLLVAFAAKYLARKSIIRTLEYIVHRTQAEWDDFFAKRRVFGRLAHLAPAVVLYFSADIFFEPENIVYQIIKRAGIAYSIFAGILVVDSILNVVNDLYERLDISRSRPIRSYMQAVKIIVFLVGGILMLAIILDKSPIVFLSGLGAMTAVIMLVFKDSILGFVASVQLSAQDMVRIGDWIEMPKYGANGDVVDITVNTVKVRNWDKTISTIPTYALISDSFKNWRGMKQSGGRRIKRALNLDMNSVRFCDTEMLDRFEKIILLKDYISEKRSELEDFNKKRSLEGVGYINGRQLTNLGTFRRYVFEYLRSLNPVSKSMPLLVRQLPPSEQGIAIEIYCFSKNTEWSAYENLQADIFDHILAVLDQFELRVFQNPGGSDFRSLVAVSGSISESH